MMKLWEVRSHCKLLSFQLTKGEVLAIVMSSEGNNIIIISTLGSILFQTYGVLCEEASP